MNVSFERLSMVRSRIESACRNAGREASEVRLLAVGKRHPASAIKALHALGLVDFGENQLQEALGKQADLAGTGITWHFVGTIQSNKTRQIAAHFEWVQSVDRMKVLRRLAGQRPPELGPLNICLQVNVDNEPQKSGLAPSEVLPLAELALTLERLRLRGLMCIPRLTDDPNTTRASFNRVHSLFAEMNEAGFNLDTLSMGMSADLELAIAEGSTMVRVGTDLFGPRPA